MAFDFKKEYKEFYMPKNKPEIVTIPKANYIAVRGKGDPNEEGGAYQQAISILYAVAYTLKMSYKTDYKIEGFFELCKKRGLTGRQGVIIPAANVRELVLSDEVVQAVKEGVFHIYPIIHISQGIELLMEMPAGEPDESGDFPEDTVHGRVSVKLKAFAQASRDA